MTSFEVVGAPARITFNGSGRSSGGITFQQDGHLDDAS
jgi:hypothetical protein